MAWGATARQRMTWNGSEIRATRRIVSSMRRLAPIPPVPASRTRGLRPWTAASSATASRESSRSRPTKRSLTERPGMVASCHTATPMRQWMTPRPAGSAGSAEPRRTATLPAMADAPEPVTPPAEGSIIHPRNGLNELSGEAWLYFTKSVWTTAYPSELGHRLRRTHGANKPPRLMARLIEFFTKTGELVLDPFAGVGGTLLGAAMARGPRRAIGIELSPRWAETYAEVVRETLAERNGLGPELVDLGPQDPGGSRGFDPSGCELRVGDALALLPTVEAASVDFVATDPPYNIQLPMTMAGGA